jgi:hypothetical protein
MKKNKKEQKQPNKRAMNAYMKFFDVAESGEILLKTGAFYEKETLKYFRRLINALSNLQKYDNLFTHKEIRKVKVEANKLLDKEMRRMKYIHSEAKKEISKFGNWVK